jgi:hypothetical protein
MNSPPHAAPPDVFPDAPREYSRLQSFAAPVSALALAAIFALAFSGGVAPTSADKVTLLFLGVLALAMWLPQTRVQTLLRRADASSFSLTAALFIVYGLARGGLQSSLTLHFSLLEDRLPVSYAALLAVGGALLSAPSWWKFRSGWTNALLCALALISLFAAGSFWFLGRYLTVGETEELDPRPMIVTLIQVVEYAALSLCCAAVCAHEKSRVLALRALPFLLLLLWARHTFFAAPLPVEADE